MQHQILPEAKLPEAKKVNEKDFFAAVAANDSARVIDYLNAGVSINSNNNPEGDTALHIALKHRHFKLFHQLMEFNPDVDMFNFSGTAAIHYAVLSGNLAAVERLVDAGASIFSLCFLKLLGTPLHIAIEANDLPITKYLLEAEVERRQQDPSLLRACNSLGMNPFMWAMHKEKHKLLDLFFKIDSAYLDEVDSRTGDTPIHNLILMLVKDKKKVRSEALSKLLKTPGGKALVPVKNNLGLSALHLAAFHGLTENVKQLVEEGNADPNSKDKMNLTPAYLARGGGHGEIVNFLTQAVRKQAIAKQLEEKKKSVSAINMPLCETGLFADSPQFVKSSTMLVDGSGSDCKSQVNALCTYQVEKYLTDSKTKTPIELGCVTQDQLQKNLIGSISSKEKLSEILRHALICKQRHVVQCIVESKLIDLNQPYKGTYFLQTAIDSGCYANINCLLTSGAHPKHCPSLLGKVLLDGAYNTLDFLLELLPEATETNCVEGEIPFFVFILFKKKRQLDKKQLYSLLEKLLPKGKEKKKGALHLAFPLTVIFDEADLVKWFIHQGIDFNQHTDTIKMAIHLFYIAIKNSSVEIADAIFHKMTAQTRSLLIKNSSESFINAALKTAEKCERLRHNIVNALRDTQCSFKPKHGQLLHYLHEKQHYDLFKIYVSSKEISPEWFEVLNKDKETVPEAIIRAGAMDILYLIFDKLSEPLRKHIVNSNLLALAKQKQHDKLAAKIEKILEAAKSTSRKKKKQSAKKPTGDSLVQKAKEVIQKDPKQAMAKLHEAANLYNSKAQRWLGHCYRLGMDGKPDKVKALAFYQASADQGDFVAKCCVAVLLDDKASAEYIKTILPDDSVQSSFENDQALFRDDEFHKKLQTIVGLAHQNKRTAELAAEARALRLFTEESKETKKKNKESKTTSEPKELKSTLCHQLDQILEVLQTQKEKLKKPSRFIAISFTMQTKHAPCPKLVDALFKHVVTGDEFGNQYSIDSYHLSKIIHTLGKNGFADYADKFFQWGKDANIADFDSALSFIIIIKKFEDARPIFEEIKKNCAHLIASRSCSAMISVASSANEYGYAKSIFEEAMKEHHENWLSVEVFSSMIAEATRAGDFAYADNVYKIAKERKIIDDHVHNAYLDALIKNKKINSSPAGDKLINEVLGHATPCKYIADEDAWDLHEQSYGSTWAGLKKDFANPKKQELTLITGQGLHTEERAKLHNTHPVRQAVIDLCKEFGWQYETDHRKRLHCYRVNRQSSAPVFPLEVKALQPISSLRTSPQKLYSSVFLKKETSAPSFTRKIKIAQPVKPSTEQLHRVKTRLAAQKLLAKSPTETQLKIIHDLINEILPMHDNSIHITANFPKHIREAANRILEITQQYSTGNVFFAGSQVLYLILNRILKALELPEEKRSSASDVDIVVQDENADFAAIGKEIFDSCGKELVNYIPRLYQAEVEGTKFDIYQAKCKTPKESAESRDFSMGSFLALPLEREEKLASKDDSKSEDEWVVYVANLDSLIDAARRVVRPIQKPTEWLARFIEGNSDDDSNYIVRFFNVFKRLIRNNRYPEEGIEEFMSCFPSFQDAMRHHKATGHVVAHLRKNLLHGNAEAFYQTTSLFEAFEVIFPFVKKTVDQKLLQQLMKNADTVYQRGKKPSLHRLVAQLLVLNTEDKSMAAVKNTINADPLLKKIFEKREPVDLEHDLQYASEEVLFTRYDATENKADMPSLVHDPLLFRAHQQAIPFLRELKQTSLLSLAENTIKKFKPSSAFSNVPFDPRPLEKQLSEINSLFKCCTRLIALDRDNAAINALKKLSMQLIQLTVHSSRALASPVKQAIALMDNITCVLLTFANQPEAIQEALSLCVKMQPDILSLIESSRQLPVGVFFESAATTVAATPEAAPSHFASPFTFASLSSS